MKTRWNILYRGPLSSCNYGCVYCPFAKKRNTREELRDDEARLKRFIDWAGERSRSREIGVLITPWGEALGHGYYQRAFIALGSMAGVYRVAAQTNLSSRLDWLERADPSKAALWCTYHPGETTRGRFLRQCAELHRRGIRHSVGVVGMREHLDEIEAMRAELPRDTYLWVNAYKRLPDYYSTGDIDKILAVDPLFPLNATRHASLGQSCRAGETSFTVDGDGDVRRCHFIKNTIGNIYDTGFEACLRPRSCSNEHCGCHIGYVNLERLQLDRAYGDGILERIPMEAPDRLAPLAKVL